MRQAKKQFVIATAAASAVLLALTACAPGQQSQGIQNTGPIEIDTSTFAGKTIDYVYFSDSAAEEEATRALISQFQDEFDATINLQIVPFANLQQSLQARLSGNEVPDVARLSSIQVGDFVDQLLDIVPYFGSDYSSEFVEGAAATVAGPNGEMWGVPSDLTMNGPIVNVDMFEAAGVALPTADDPWTWDEMVAASEEVQAATGSEFAMAIDKSGHRVSGVVSAFGTTMIGADGQNAMDPEAMTAAITALTDLMADDRMSRDFWLGSGSAYAGANDIFLAQATPLYISGNWQVSQFADNASFEWATIPNACSVECGGFPGLKNMVAFNRSDEPEMSAYFINWMNQTEQQEQIANTANWLPTRVDLTEAGIDYDLRPADMNVFLGDVTVTPTVTFASTSSPAFNGAGMALVDVISEVVGGQMTVAEAVASLNIQIDEIVEQTSR